MTAKPSSTPLLRAATAAATACLLVTAASVPCFAPPAAESFEALRELATAKTPAAAVARDAGADGRNAAHSHEAHARRGGSHHAAHAHAPDAQAQHAHEHARAHPHHPRERESAPQRIAAQCPCGCKASAPPSLGTSRLAPVLPSVEVERTPLARAPHPPEPALRLSLAEMALPEPIPLSLPS